MFDRVSERLPAALLLIACLAVARVAWAQDSVWLQIEARPTLASAEERARDYAGRLDNVAGFRLRSGWYAIALGPYPSDLAAQELARLRAQGIVPRDSFVSDGAGYGDRFWPGGTLPGITTVTIPEPDDSTATEGADDGGAATAPPLVETLQDARAAERLLSRAEREDIQRALQTLGFYTTRIDGAFGPGTRRAMAAWQRAFGHEGTGVLTTAQRQELVEGLRDAMTSLSMQRVFDTTAGIEIEIPAAEVAFKGYQAPFAHYAGDAVQVLLISQAGDAATLRSLYDVMQTLEIVPLEGARDFGRSGFTLTGRNDEIASYTYATLADGAVKGFTLVWPTGDEFRRRLAVDRMQASFAPIAGSVLPDTAGDRTLERPDLLAGFRIRQPEATLSGFFVDARGSVVTAASAIGSCARITLGEEADAEVAALDPDLDLALLTPRAALVPLGIGRLSAEVPRLSSDIAVAGYSYGGILGAPTMSFGTLEDTRGLDGGDRVARLALTVEPGDTGGPVLDAGGAVVGMLLPRPNDDGRTLPDGVHFAADAAAIAGFLAANGVDLASADTTQAPLAPEDLALVGADMTVLVSCWD